MNPDFIYQSQHATFRVPAVPIIERNSLATIDGSGTHDLRDVLQQILAPLSGTGVQAPVINFGCSYSYQLVADSLGVGPSVSWPILELMAIEVPNDVSATVDQIATEIEDWHKLTTPLAAPLLAGDRQQHLLLAGRRLAPLLASFLEAGASSAAPPTLLRGASVRSTTFSPFGRSFGRMVLPARFWLIKSTSAVS